MCNQSLHASIWGIQAALLVEKTLEEFQALRSRFPELMDALYHEDTDAMGRIDELNGVDDLWKKLLEFKPMPPILEFDDVPEED